MKHGLLTLLVVITANLFCQTDATEKKINGPEITFKTDVIDLDTITYTDTSNFIFEFTNTGTEYLVIERARASCDCMYAKYPHNPIKPGQGGFIIVDYSYKRIGCITKNVTVTSNAINAPAKILSLKVCTLPPTDDVIPEKQRKTIPEK